MTRRQRPADDFATDATQPRIVPDPRVDPAELDRRRVEKASGKVARARHKRHLAYSGGFKTEAEYAAEAARDTWKACKVRGCRGCGLEMYDGACSAHARAGFRRKSMEELEPMREGCCNAARRGGTSGGKRGGNQDYQPRGSRCRATNLGEDGRCPYHRGVVLNEDPLDGPRGAGRMGG